MARKMADDSLAPFEKDQSTSTNQKAKKISGMAHSEIRFGGLQSFAIQHAADLQSSCAGRFNYISK